MKNPTLSQEIQMWMVNVYLCPVDEIRFEDIAMDLQKAKDKITVLEATINKYLQQ